MRAWPAWWDRLFHRRPQRRQETEQLNQIKQGEDPDSMTWPSGRKPHRYFW